MTTTMRTALKAELESRLKRHSVVVWEDPEGEYRSLVDDLIPENARFERFRGSWYELRRRIDEPLGGVEPELIIYVDQRQPANSPLEEARSIGTKYTRRVGHLLKQVLGGELPDDRLEEIASHASTLEEAEHLAGAGGRGVPADLTAAFGATEPGDLALALLDNELPKADRDIELLEACLSFLGPYLGFSSRVAQSTELALAMARHLVLVEISGAGVPIPVSLAEAIPSPDDQQKERCARLLSRWLSDERRREGCSQTLREVDQDLELASQLEWSDAMTRLDSVPAFDELAVTECVQRINDSRFKAAVELASSRLTSRWARVDADGLGSLHHEWRTLVALAELRQEIDRTGAPSGPLPDLLEEYSHGAWKVDQAHRHFERALLDVVDRHAISDVVIESRNAYEQWLDRYVRASTSALEEAGLESGGLLMQTDIDQKVLTPLMKEPGRVALFIVDALRLEMGHELAAMVERQHPGAEVGISAALGLVPSTTTVGMAALCPGADAGLTLSVVGDKLKAFIDGDEIAKPKDRIARFQAAYGTVVDLRMDELLRLADDEIRERTEDAELVIVRSQEIDESSEAGKLAISLPSMDQMISQLARSIARLHQKGVREFVVTSDHGFIFLAEEVGPHMIVPKPGGEGALQRRAFVGSGGTAGDAVARIPFSKLGLSGPLDLLLPRGLALFAAGGSRGFFHGGAAPQEMLVPAITANLPEPQGNAMVKISASLSSRITSEIFTGRVELESDLLAERIAVRPVAMRDADGREIAALATAGGAEEGEGLVQLEPGESVSLGFRLTSSLGKGEDVVLRIYDARSDRILAQSAAVQAARALGVDDELAVN